MLFPRVQIYIVFLMVISFLSCKHCYVRVLLRGHLEHIDRIYLLIFFVSRIRKLHIGLQSQGLSQQLERVQDWSVWGFGVESRGREGVAGGQNSTSKQSTLLCL